MKMWKKITSVVCGAFFLMGSLYASSLAWFTTGNKASVDQGLGYTASNYFASGNGTAEDPYVINKPIHLYNLAWLQYLGFFNRSALDSSTSKYVYQQTHFTLGADLDMSSTSSVNWTLPPIGTTAHPFIGTFDGGNYVISNLHVDNVLSDAAITKKPASIANGSTLSGVNIVGVFGVIGNYNDVLQLSGGSYTYNSSANYVKNVYLENAVVKSSLSQTLIGVAAGYVNATLQGVGISDSFVSIASGSTNLDSSLTTNISDYMSVGYATSSFRASRNLSTVNFTNSNASNYSFTEQEQGSLSGWGGSIDMGALYTRLSSFRNASTPISYTSGKSITIAVDGSSTSSITGTGYFREYYDTSVAGNAATGTMDSRLKGSYSFSNYDSNDDQTTGDITSSYIYLYGQDALTTQVTTTVLNRTGYLIHYGGYYLTANGTSGVTQTTSFSNASTWLFSNFSGTGTISTDISGTTYYLNGTTSSGSTGALHLSTSASTNWTKSGNTIYFTTGSWWLTYWYLHYSNGFILYKGSSTSFAFSQDATTTNETQDSGVSTRDTYFPLNVDSSYYPTESNTGYVVSGSSYKNPDTTNGYPHRSGDVRVSKYNFYNLSTAFDGASSYNDSAFEILTQTSSTNGLKRVSDSHNATNTTVSSSISSYEKIPYTTLGLQKYKKSRDAFGTLLSSDTNVYGLHFMDSMISTANIATADLARVRKAGTEIIDYANYEMPRDSIDFNLRKKGYINFFGGTYFSGNNSFFSLHKIIRNADESIASIKKISKIYGNGIESDDYAYLYSDGTYSSGPSLPNGYSEIFDTAWISTPSTMITNAVYYYEIPVNDGEYCLGSVNGYTGAYLLYLDISANAQLVNRTMVTEYLTNSMAAYRYPLGVAMVATPTSGAKEAVDELTGSAVSLGMGYAGSFGFAKANGTITFSSDSSSFSPVFKGDGIALAWTGHSSPPLVPYASSVSTSKRITYIDYNASLNETTKTLINDVDGVYSYVAVDASGNSAVATEYYDNDGNLIVVSETGDPAIDVSGCTNGIFSLWYSYSADKSTISLSFTLGYSTSTITLDGADFVAATPTGYTLLLTSGAVPLSIHISLKNGAYAITLNGTEIHAGDVINVAIG